MFHFLSSAFNPLPLTPWELCWCIQHDIHTYLMHLQIPHPWHVFACVKTHETPAHAQKTASLFQSVGVERDVQHLCTCTVVSYDFLYVQTCQGSFPGPINLAKTCSISLQDIGPRWALMKNCGWEGGQCWTTKYVFYIHKQEQLPGTRNNIYLGKVKFLYKKSPQCNLY